MRLTKYSHSCVRFDNGSDVMVIDPGVFSEIELALEGAQAVLITHEHADHLDATGLWRPPAPTRHCGSGRRLRSWPH